MPANDGSNAPERQQRSLDRAGETNRHPATDERPALKRYDGLVPTWARGEERIEPSSVAREATALVDRAEREAETVVDELAGLVPGRESSE